MNPKRLPPIDRIEKVVTAKSPGWPHVDEAIIDNVVKILRTESLSQLGKDEQVLCRFEKAWAAYCGTEYALSCNGGTSALAMAVGACTEPGDEVIVTTYSWNASALAIVHANAIPVFADIDPKTLTIDPAGIERLITRRTRAIIAVHLYGHPCDMDPIMELARRHNLVVIEDAAQAHGATYKGRKVGSLGHIGCFSHQGSKNLPAGEGGSLMTNDLDLFRRCVTVGAHPARQNAELPPEMAERYHVGEFCENYRMHPLGAAILEAGLPMLDERNAHRRRNVESLYARLHDIPGVEPGFVSPDVEHVFHIAPMFFRPEQLEGVPRRLWMRILAAKGVGIGSYVTTPLHLRRRVQQHAYYGKGCPWECPFGERAKEEPAEGHCPAAERHCAEHEITMSAAGLWKPCEELLDQVAQAFRETSEEAPVYAKELAAAAG